MRNILLIIVLCFSMSSRAQSLLDELTSENTAKTTDYTEGTFKTVRLINGQTSEITGKKELDLIISHRFNEVKGGMYDFFGIDESVMRLGVEYGLFDWLSLGYGRGNLHKMYDGYAKFKLFRQCSGVKNFPVTITWYSAFAATAEKWIDPDRDNLFSSRLSYTHEIIVARKFNSRFSLQLINGAIHRNLVETRKDQNLVPYSAFGWRLLVTKRLSVNGEYYYVYPGETARKFNNSLSIGVDVETGGHVFQLHFSNSRGMIEKSFVPETYSSWGKGEFNFGFNIIRNFSFK